MNATTMLPAPVSGRAADRGRYEALMDVLRERATSREFDPGYRVPRAHYDMILDAACLAPSGANAQPWHYVVVTSAWTKKVIADYFVQDQQRRAKAGRFHNIDYGGLATAPGFIVVVTDPRLTWAFPGMMDGSELDQRFHATAERILLQSVAASTMAAHLAAASLGYQSWWVSALGLDDAKSAIQALLGVPEDLHITDFMLFGPSLEPQTPRWKKQRDQVASWDRFNMDGFKSVEEIDAWMRDLRKRALEGLDRKLIE